ncbi:MAG: hypothetical protein HY909_16175 [Deltaproteobacteria bacterium]|nr:hypothetical protein [Deltaproteobacteria bacterium]
MRRALPLFLSMSLLGARALAQGTSNGTPSPEDPAPPRDTAPPAPAPQPRALATPSGGPTVTLRLPGELQLRFNALTDIPLQTTPGRTDQSTVLGQNLWAEHWFRFRPTLSIGERFRVLSAFDIARLVLAEAYPQDVGLSREQRLELLPVNLFDLRQLYVEWESPVGLLRVGQQGFTSGLGMLANDGDRTPLFGDYRQGDLVERVAFATRPFGRQTDLTVAVAGDLIYRDRVASLAAGDIALQGVLAMFYQDHACRARCDRRRVGGYVAWRDITYRQDLGTLGVAVGDLYARWEWPQPDHLGRVFAGLELAGLLGSTDVARTQFIDHHRIVQFGAVAEVGFERDERYRVALEGGYASGDSNPVDGAQRRFTFNPSYRVGMILFPEVVAWQTARSASIASDPNLLGRPTHGAFLLPSSGGVTGAMYLYPQASFNLSRHLEVRGAMVVAMASTDWVDPVSVQLVGSARNFRGGDASRRDLGVELDLGLLGDYELARGVSLQGGLQGGVLFPGRAFDDAAGNPMQRVAMVQARMGLKFQ